MPNRGECIRGDGSFLNYFDGDLLIPRLLDLVPSGEMEPETFPSSLKFGLA